MPEEPVAAHQAVACSSTALDTARCLTYVRYALKSGRRKPDCQCSTPQRQRPRTLRKPRLHRLTKTRPRAQTEPREASKHAYGRQPEAGSCLGRRGRRASSQLAIHRKIPS